jgi:uncharacterized membrane protein YfcA
MRWARLPPVWERTLWDDLRWGVFVLTGAALGYLVFGADDPGLLLGAFLGVVLAIAVLNVVRRVRPRRKT